MTGRTLAVILALLFVRPAGAEEVPFAELSVSPERVTVGEPITLRVAVYVPTWFAKPPTFPSFEMPNTITRLPPNSSRPSTRRVGRESWSGIVRSYRIYPLIGARFRLESQTIEFEYANPGSDPVPVKVDTGEIVFTAVVPDGAENLSPYVAGSRLSLTRSMDGEADSLVVGDAIVVTYAAELDGLPALFLPEIVPTRDIPGVSVYPEQPVVEDTSPARRTERLTYIFNAGGEFEIPAVAIDWWNTETEAIETAALAAIPIVVAGPVASDVASARAPTTRDLLTIAAALAALLFAGWTLRKPMSRWADRRRERQRERLESEPYAWTLAKKGLDSGDQEGAYVAIVGWLERLEPGLDSRQFCTEYGNEDLAESLEALSRSLFDASAYPVDLVKLRRSLTDARGRYLTLRHKQTQSALPALNP